MAIFINSEDSFEPPKKIARANGNIYHIFKPNDFEEVQNLYQDKESIDLTPGEHEFSTCTCWNENYQSLFLI